MAGPGRLGALTGWIFEQAPREPNDGPIGNGTLCTATPAAIPLGLPRNDGRIARRPSQASIECWSSPEKVKRWGAMVMWVCGLTLVLSGSPAPTLSPKSGELQSPECRGCGRCLNCRPRQRPPWPTGVARGPRPDSAAPKVARYRMRFRGSVFIRGIWMDSDSSRRGILRSRRAVEQAPATNQPLAASLPSLVDDLGESQILA